MPTILQLLSDMITAVNGWVWGVPMCVAIVGVGLYLTLGLRGLPLRRLGRGIKLLISPSRGEGAISPFYALMTSLSATIGTGNIAGVATAIALGGPGAVFWMWMTALLGMATKYAEAVLAVHFREWHGDQPRGGPMYYIEKGLGRKWRWLAVAFAFFGVIAGFGIGNTVQSNSVAVGLAVTYSLDPIWTGAVMSVLVAAVVLGGIQRIAHVAGAVVPFMAAAYLCAGLFIVINNIALLPGVFGQIINDAFSGTAATGGFAGATIAAAIRFGVARGIFSNEAGLGSAPIAHAYARTNNPVEQGFVAMLGTFIDTIIVCSVTAFVIIISGEWMGGQSSSALTSASFSLLLPGFGEHIVVLGLVFFALTTLLGWSVYGERCVVYLLGDRSVVPFRVAWIAAVPLGAMANLEFIWLLADTFNAMMALPNLLALLLLSPVVFRLTRQYQNAA